LSSLLLKREGNHKGNSLMYDLNLVNGDKVNWNSLKIRMKVIDKLVHKLVSRLIDLGGYLKDNVEFGYKEDVKVTVNYNSIEDNLEAIVSIRDLGKRIDFSEIDFDVFKVVTNWYGVREYVKK